MENQSFASNRSVGSFKRTTRRSARKTERNAIFAVLRGVLVAAAITIIGVAVFALILNWWNASDRAITAINQVVDSITLADLVRHYHEKCPSGNCEPPIFGG